MSAILLYKICITMLAVLGLSFIAEKFSARLAGLLSGYPIGTAIILHFYGLEYGADFAADAAVFNLCGLLASQCFAYAYYRTSLRTEAIFPVSVVAIAAYLSAAFTVSQVNPDRAIAVAIAVIATSLFCILMRTGTSTGVATPKAWSFKLIALRLAFTASLVVLVTETADIFEPAWAGLFQRFRLPFTR